MTFEGLGVAMRSDQHQALRRWFGRTRWRSRLLIDFAVFLTAGDRWYVFLPIPCDGFHGLVIDLRPLGHRPSDASPVIEMLRGQGYRVDVCNCWESARTGVERYLGRFAPLQVRE